MTQAGVTDPRVKWIAIGLALSTPLVLIVAAISVMGRNASIAAADREIRASLQAELAELDNFKAKLAAAEAELEQAKLAVAQGNKEAGDLERAMGVMRSEIVSLKSQVAERIKLTQTKNEEVVDATTAEAAAGSSDVAEPPAGADGAVTSEVIYDGVLKVEIVTAACANAVWEEYGKVNTGADPSLYVRIKVTNITKDRIAMYKGFNDMAIGAKYGCRDAKGNAYRQINFGIGAELVGSVKDVTLRPGESCLDNIIFEVPLAFSEQLTLRISVECFGGSGFNREKLELPFPNPEYKGP